LVLFEAMFDRMWVKRYVAGFFLRALPFRAELADVVCRWVRTADDPLVQRAATELAMTLGGPSAVRLAETWAVSDDDDERVAGLITLGHWGTDLDAELLEKSLESPWPIARRAVYAAGMSGSLALRTWADDPERCTDVRRAARWWLAQGSRVTD
ncbi:MAG: hypothetical protein JWO46_233, partial [Nocardioidaceae bacterium]|nr:hypothetical protein [Nocardioidaceae bacterium]